MADGARAAIVRVGVHEFDAEDVRTIGRDESLRCGHCGLSFFVSYPRTEGDDVDFC